jgi:predicted metal-dependent hydrolase
MFGASEPAPAAPLDPENWRDCEPYLYGIDLFNHGYYWEAHEAWEAVWHAAGRRGPTADFLKALIKLAAAAVKAREGSLAGAARHARRSRELVSAVASSGRQPLTHFAGLYLSHLDELSVHIESAATDRPMPIAVYDAVLRPS